jgi:hypothetical protein
MPTIYVSRQGNSANLRLRDSEGNNPGNDQITTLVDPGNIVTWELDPRADINSPEHQNGYFPIYELISVKKADSTKPQYLHSTDVLVSDPPPPVNGVITGLVKSPSPGKGRFENYQITYLLLPGGQPVTDDPVMQMNS